MRCDTVGMELRNPSIYSRNTQCIVNLERDYVPHTKNGFTHKEATVQTWNSLDVRMDGQTGRRAAFLSSRLRAPDAGCVLLLC